MFLLKKVFQLRDKANPDNEKPFLDHLEDLRVMISRIVMTLLVSMLICFSFQDQLMVIIRKPVNEVMAIHETKMLPSDVDRASWDQARKIEHAIAGLEPANANYILAQFDEKTRMLVDAVRLLRASIVLPEAKRAEFLQQAKADPPMAELIKTLLANGAQPEIDARGNLQMMTVLTPTEPFMLSMKLAFFAGIVLAFPLLLLFVLQFVLPGLHSHEKKVLWPALAIGFGLFLIGVCFAYFAVLPRALTFFFEWGLSMGVSNDWRIGEYVTFATQFTLLFGLSFELPVVVMVLVKLGLLTYESMSRTRSYAILAIVVAAAVITPTPDAFTMCLMAGPMIILYEICIWLAWFDAKKQRETEAAEDSQRLERLLDDERATEQRHDDEPEGGEEEDRGDHWDPSSSEEGWKAGQEDETPAKEHDAPVEDSDTPAKEGDTPPDHGHGEEKR
ncbi:twin-arginine translocase subunit TatC [Luteolibacter soli]|uniref:Sec-independent protein translocase protein TatC n=1 Tax=Luteolibacter soli TaxID=3135280 RepID=A0ABU9AMU4_9BACT